MEVNVKARQTLLDISVQTAGTLDSLFELASLNGMGITDELVAGQTLTAPAVALFEVADYFRKYKLYPASATTPLSALLPEGIEFWSIEFDFIVS
jgi:hypothetical protein